MGAPAAVGSAPGRACPIAYRYSPSVFRRAAEFECEVLLVAGGVYGNRHALEALGERASRERLATRVVLNGDFHWFDATAQAFAAIEAARAPHLATRGNVETEIAAADELAGCGCGYPEWVGDGDVARSNEIMTRLRAAAAGFAGERAALAALPMHRLAQVGALRVAIVHGDAWSLAGWAFTQETVTTGTLDEAFRASDVDVFASSHTCLPVALDTVVDGRARALVNNGAAGMPNFAGERFGLATRIAIEPAPDALYRRAIGGVYIEAIPLAYDFAAWDREFAGAWPAGTPAATSYGRRIAGGPDYRLEQAVRGRFVPLRA